MRGLGRDVGCGQGIVYVLAGWRRDRIGLLLGNTPPFLPFASLLSKYMARRQRHYRVGFRGFVGSEFMSATLAWKEVGWSSLPLGCRCAWDEAVPA